MLEIIPVIDVREGKVVHASGGVREAYPPLRSVLTQSVDVVEVLSDLLAWFPFPKVYIADLDAIERGNHDIELYRALSHHFKHVDIWLDCGIESTSQLSPFSELPNISPVLGSETLQDLSVLKDKEWRHKLVLSLDRKQQTFLGKPELLADSDLWPERTIVMSLDHVGSAAGPALDWSDQLRSIKPNLAWFLAGGVRDETDLEQVEKSGCAGVLIASALHTGRIDKNCVSRFMEQEHRPS